MISKLKYKDIIDRQDELSERVYTSLKNFQLKEKLVAKLSKDKTIQKAVKLLEENKGNINNELMKKSSKIIKSSKVYLEYNKATDELSNAKSYYFKNLFEYIKSITKDREALFSEKYNKRIDELAKQGYFFYQLQTPDIPEKILFSDEYIKLIESYVYNNLSYMFSKIFEDTKDSFVPLEISKNNDLKEALNNLYMSQYNSCAKTLFSLLENDHRNASGLNEFAKGYKRQKEIAKKVKNLKVDYYINAWNKINDYYSIITCRTDKWDKKHINRNALMHGIYERETNREDCVKLFLMYISFKELSFIVQQIDDFIMYAEMTLNVLKVMLGGKHEL